jgi:hypothetical protein
MPTLGQRVAFASITATFLPLPKGKKRGRGVGFCGGDPIASVESTGNTAPPFRWIAGKPELITFPEAKTVVPSGTSATQLAGLRYTPKHDERALVWTRTDGTMSGVELHPERWDKSSAFACGDGQQVGYGYEKFVKNPSRALLWSGSRESMVVLTGPDPTRDVQAKGAAQGVQVGCFGGSIRLHACLWRGTSASYVDLHPTAPELIGSDALGVGDGQQVGHVWGEEMTQRAALWSGSPESYVNLAPKRFVRSTARRCARGFQVGWAAEQESGMKVRAILWNGTADDYIDLQQFLPETWNVSQALDLHVDGDRLRIIGTAQQAVQSGGYEVDAGAQPVIWEMKLLVAEPKASRETAVLLPAPAKPAAEEISDETKVEQAASAFAQAIIDDDYTAAHKLLAPWLRKQVTAKKLKAILGKAFLADVKPVDFVLSGNDSTLDELRRHYREYYKDDKARTLASTESFGDWGPPSIYLADAITQENFRQWMWVDFTPDLDDESGLDYCLRVYLIVADLGGTMQIGHLEPE